MTDSERFERLWRENVRAVLRYAARRVSPAAVDDVVAETFVVAWRRLDDVPEFALPWLSGVARGVAANTARAGFRRRALVQRLATQPEMGHDKHDDGPDVTLEALRQLSSRDQELLTLIAWDGLKPHEAAVVLGCSTVAVRVRLHRARARFRAALIPAPAAATALMENP